MANMHLMYDLAECYSAEARHLYVNCFPNSLPENISKIRWTLTRNWFI